MPDLFFSFALNKFFTNLFSSKNFVSLFCSSGSLHFQDISTSEINSRAVRGNDVDFPTIKITLKKVCGNDVDFSISEITSKKSTGKRRGFFDQRNYIEKVRGNLAFIVSISYQRRIDVDLTWCARWESCEGRYLYCENRGLLLLHQVSHFT